MGFARGGIVGTMATAPRTAGNSIAAWLEQYAAESGGDVDVCRRALDLTADLPGTCRAELLELLEILERLAPDPETVACALLAAVCDHRGSVPGEIDSQFPATLARQLHALQRLRRFRAEMESRGLNRGEGLRRLLLALADDIRVVLLLLAEQLLRLRGAMDADDETRRALGRDALDLYAPLANRLGVWQLKWELEDLAFRFTDPETYQRIARLLAERRGDRERFISEFLNELRRVLAEAGLEAQVTGRPKHIYSIWRKMQRKQAEFDELYDLRAVRVLVDGVGDCYAALGAVHTHWQPIPGEFDDYISQPKGNNYQSLHTAVVGPAGKAVEVQIRTHAMHEHAELGVAAHWRYKEGGPHDSGFEDKVQAMRQLLDASGDMDSEALFETFQSAASEERVYALTPQGDVVDLVAGSTVLDFAYHIHTSIGHRCRGAKVNGRIVPLTHQVATGERVEILTAREPRPSRDWLSRDYLHSGRARNKVRQWFRQIERDRNVEHGREALERELQRTALDHADPAPVLARFNCANIEDLHAAIGAGDLTATQVANAIARHLGELTEREAPMRLTRRRERRRASGDSIRIEGVGNLMHQMARCCQPVPGDPIIGYITRGRGVSIHRQDCANVLRLQTDRSARLVDVNWSDDTQREHPVDVRIVAYDRKGLLRDISVVIAGANAGVESMHTDDEAGGDTVTVTLDLTVRVADFEQLTELLARVNDIHNVVEARRVRRGG